EVFARWVVADALTLEPKPVAVGGLELGAVPVACCVMSHSDGLLRTFIVRKQKKEHGAEQQIEGRVEAGDRVIVVDDVITTGAATQKAIDAVEARGGEVVAVYCLVDRQEDTLPELAARGIRSAMTLDDLIAATS
ncbi:MAG: hypothetical protein KJO07_11835, partial [Deltaproteobacteria bacterium]|nr:hypothetical protein [Deltaproteobacteria bacterium]